MDRVVISKLLESDPDFERFVAALYGVSKMHDPSEVHVTSSGDRKRDKRLAQTGLAATGVASIGGLHAIHATLHSTRKIGPITRKLPVKAKTAAAIGTAGWLGLHGVELVGDSLAARAQVKELKKDKVKKRAGHFQPVALVAANSRARKAGLRQSAASPTVNKGFRPLKGVQDAMKLNEGVHSAEHARAMGRVGMSARVEEGKAAFAGRTTTRSTGARHSASAPKGGGHRATPAISGRMVALGGSSVASVGAGSAGTLAVQRRRSPQAVNKAVHRSVEWRGDITKFDADKRQVFGWASVSKVDGEPVVDRQGDYIPIEEAETSAYRYMLTSRLGGDMHRRVSKLDLGPVHTADVIESVVFTPEKLEALGLEPDAVPLGWWIGFQINDDEVWQDIKEGRRTGFSVHGSGTRRDAVLV